MPLLSMTGPLILALPLATEEINIDTGLEDEALMGIIIDLAMPNFLEMRKPSRWTSERKSPTLVGKALTIDLVHPAPLVLAGYLRHD